jgi:hypothetical protein
LAWQGWNDENSADSSPWIPIPPKNYGGTESVLSPLVEKQVAQGHEVTLFAPGDAKTSAKLVSFFPQSLLKKGIPWTMQLKAFYHLQKAVEQVREQAFDICIPIFPRALTCICSL